MAIRKQLFNPFPIDRNLYEGIIPRCNLYAVSRLFWNIAASLSPGTDVIDAFSRAFHSPRPTVSITRKL